MKNNWILISGVFGFLGVALGAFGAHGLKDRLDAYSMGVYQTGVHYQLFHTLALFALALAMTASPNIAESKAAHVAASAWSIGIVLFSGSLYALALSGVTKLGAITPIGGLCFLIGWASVIFRGFKLVNS